METSESKEKSEKNGGETAQNAMELLAPAGSLDAFHAAIEAGANAVYLGLNEHNARLRAKNFTMKTLSFLIPYAHQRGKRIYVTLNTLVKQHEMATIIDTLYQLEQVRVDGIIVTDLGLIHLCRTHFPRLQLHASTQMTLHNSACIKTIQDLGVKRIILPRELTIEEITAIREKTNADLELFIHGALCYSLSGVCLASSFLGGSSGNRGRCTQVCRRGYTSEKRNGFFFSPGDFWAIDFLSAYRTIGIKALKIEGRMKSAEYVFHVVSLYRAALDHPDQIAEIKEKLHNDFGRKKNTFFLHGIDQKNIIQTDAPSGSGIYLGTVHAYDRESITLNTESEIAVGDRIRFQNVEGDKGFHVRVLELKRNNGAVTVTCDHGPNVKIGDQVYLISKKSASRSVWSGMRVSVKPSGFSRMPPSSLQRIVRQYHAGNIFPEESHSKIQKRSSLYVSINSLDWLKSLDHTMLDGIIVQLSETDLEFFKAHITQFSLFRKKVIFLFPPFIPESDCGMWKESATRIAAHGFTQWMVSNVGQKELIPDHATLFAGPQVWTINKATCRLLHRLGFSFFSYSLEDDVLNLKSIAQSQGFLVIYGLVPLFISRMAPALRNKAVVTDSRNENFMYLRHDHLHYLFCSKPFSLTHRKEKLEELGITHFILDFSFQQPSKTLFKDVLVAYQRNIKIPHTTLFNHKRGLK